MLFLDFPQPLIVKMNSAFVPIDLTLQLHRPLLRFADLMLQLRQSLAKLGDFIFATRSIFGARFDFEA